MRLDGMGKGLGAMVLAFALAAGPGFAQGTGDNAPASPPASATPPATPPAATPPAATPPAGAPAAPGTPAAGPFVFASPPSAQANRIYSVNVRTGEVSACQFERPEGSLVGVTRCFRTDASAGPREPGPYDIVSTRYSGETGIFRVNAQTGQMSVCYVRDMPKDGGGVEPAVVCTAPSR